MNWEDQAIILHVGKFSETSAIVTGFGEHQGLFRSVAKGGLSKKSRGLYQPGNLVSVRWSARLAEHMGNIQAEAKLSVAALIMQDALALSALNSLCGLLVATQIDHDPHPALYAQAHRVLLALAEGEAAWQRDYVFFELLMLQEGGFRVDLSHCAATGSRDELIYVSPKSGRAVCREAGEPYRDRLLPLPGFLHREGSGDLPKPAQILDALRITGYFLEHWLLVPHSRHLPAGRDRLTQLLGAQATPAE